MVAPFQGSGIGDHTHSAVGDGGATITADAISAGGVDLLEFAQRIFTVSIEEDISSGVTGATITATVTYFTKFTPTQTFLCDSLEIRPTAVGDNVKLGIYADSAGVPSGAPLAETDSTVPVAGDWQNILLTTAVRLNASTQYWIAYQANGTSTAIYYANNTAGRKQSSTTFGTLPLSPSMDGGTATEFHFHTVGEQNTYW